MHIEKATIREASSCFAIRREAILAQCTGFYPRSDLAIWTSGTMSETFAKCVAEHFHVAVVDAHVVGTGMIDLSTGKIDAVFVLPGYMRRGIGRALMDYLEGLALGAGLGSIHLDSTLNAATFYRALGFEGRDRSIYESSLGVSLACVPMVKRLQVGLSSVL